MLWKEKTVEYKSLKICLLVLFHFLLIVFGYRIKPKIKL